jgi:hypothetical protein
MADFHTARVKQLGPRASNRGRGLAAETKQPSGVGGLGEGMPLSSGIGMVRLLVCSPGIARCLATT